MVHKSKSENLLVKEKSSPPLENIPEKQKNKKSEDFNNHFSKVDKTTRHLENSLMESHDNDKKLLLTLQRDNVKNEKLAYQLEEARKENKQLLNVLQQQCSDQDSSRSATRSQIDTSSSYSTISMVHLQYKHEELLASHEGLLKVLESKIKESNKCHKENEDLRDEIQSLFQQISDNEKTIKTLCDKYLNLKARKDRKIENLKFERDTIKLAHNQVVKLLHDKCMDEDNILSEELQKSSEPAKALLVREIRYANKLQYENARLQHENAVLKSQLGIISRDFTQFL